MLGKQDKAPRVGGRPGRATHADAIKDHAGRDHSRVARGAALSSEHRGQCSEVRAKNPTIFALGFLCKKRTYALKSPYPWVWGGSGPVRIKIRTEPATGTCAHTRARAERRRAADMRPGMEHEQERRIGWFRTLRSVLGSFSTLTPSKKLGSFSPKYSRTTTHLNARISTISSEAMLHKLAIRLSNSISRRDAFLLLHTPLSHSAMARSLGGQRA